MQYQGGKSVVGPKIAPILISALRPGGAYLEPFMGAGGVARHVARHYPEAYLFDAMPDLVLLWQALHAGWVPPDDITEEQYRALRHAEPSALRAFVGFGCSFGGKWFGGYARDKKGEQNTRSFAGQASRTLAAKIADLDGRPMIQCADYRDLEPSPLDVVYCDPPYANTCSYAGAPEPFDTEAFWATALGWAIEGCRVFVSEYEAPAPWVRVWAQPRTKHMRGSGTQTDGLYTTPNVVADLGLDPA